MPERWRLFSALALLCIIWGYNWVVMKKALLYMGPFDFNATRIFLGAVVLFVYMLFKGISLKPRQVILTILVGLFQTAVSTGFILWALVEGGAGKTAVLVYTLPFWILIFARLILSEKINGINWIPVVIGFIGLAVLFEPWSPRNVISELLAVVAGMFWALGAVIIKVAQREPDVDIIPLTAWQLLYGSVPLIMAAILIPSRPINWTPYLLGALAYNTVIVCAIAFLLWTYTIQKLPAGIAGMGILAVPVIGVGTSIYELGERPDIWEAGGMILIISALALLTYFRNHESKWLNPQTNLK